MNSIPPSLQVVLPSSTSSITDPSGPEEYKLLQECKPNFSNGILTNREKMREVLALYSKSIDILETAQTVMKLDNLPSMYGMNANQINLVLSQTMAEKLQLEDYLNDSLTVMTDNHSINEFMDSYSS